MLCLRNTYAPGTYAFQFHTMAKLNYYLFIKKGQGCIFEKFFLHVKYQSSWSASSKNMSKVKFAACKYTPTKNKMGILARKPDFIACQWQKGTYTSMQSDQPLCYSL